MRSRCLSIVLVLLGAVAAVRAETPKPNVIVQAKPLDEWLLDAKQLAKDLGPLLKDALPSGKDPEKFIDDSLTQFLGPDWRKIIDTTKPFGGYGIAKEDLADGIFVAMLPIKDVKEAVKLLANFGIMPEEKNGLYTFKPPNSPTPVFARAANGYVYAGPSAEALAPENLLAPDAVFAAKETSSLVARIRLDAISAEAKKKAVSELEEAVKNDGSADSEYGKKFAKELFNSLKMVLEDGREWTLGLDFNRKHGELALVTEILPKPGTPLAKKYQEAKPTTSRFAGMAHGAALFMGQRYAIPVFDDLIKELDKSVDEFHAELAKLGITADKEQLAKLMRTIIACANTGVTDAGIAIYIGADRKATAIYAIRIKDGEKAEQAVDEFVKSLPEKERDRIKLNAGKIESVNLHRIDLGKDAPEPVQKIFGKAEATLAIGHDILAAAIGPDADKQIKAMLGDKPQPASLFVIEASLARLWPVFEQLATTDDQREMLKKARQSLGTDFDQVRLLQLTRTPGESMKYRLGIDLIPIARVVGTLIRSAPKEETPKELKPSKSSPKKR